jgi:hypothetical protein
MKRGRTTKPPPSRCTPAQTGCSEQYPRRAGRLEWFPRRSSQTLVWTCIVPAEDVHSPSLAVRRWCFQRQALSWNFLFLRDRVTKKYLEHPWQGKAAGSGRALRCCSCVWRTNEPGAPSLASHAVVRAPQQRTVRKAPGPPLPRLSWSPRASCVSIHPRRQVSLRAPQRTEIATTLQAFSPMDLQRGDERSAEAMTRRRKPLSPNNCSVEATWRGDAT